MSSINILHLSDLHISSKKLSATSKKLIKDIEKQTKKMDKILLVVSGDIVDKGEYAKYKDGVITFFEQLKTEMGTKIQELFIVPGNHDKENGISNNLFGQLSQTNAIDISEDVWHLQDENYCSYLDLIKSIRNALKLKTKKCTKTFGVEYCQIEDKIICIIEIDTTWGTYGSKTEEGKLVIGKYQLETLIKQYENIKEKLEESGKEIAITIGVGHHPISWLNPEQQKIIKKYMVDEEYFNMNLYLCGHIHDMDLENWYNNEHSMMTLVTGIGWNHRNENSEIKDKKDEHRYSLYMIDTSRNTCDILMRKSQKSGHFISDYSVYVNDEGSSGKLCCPLKIENSSLPFINLNSPNGDLVKSLFVDVKMLDIIKKTHYMMVNFRKKSDELLFFYKKNYIERISYLYVGNEEYEKIISALNQRFYSGDKTERWVEKIFNDNINIVYEHFAIFMQELLTYFVDIFIDCFPEESNLRVHFRCYNRNDDEYLKLFQYSNIDHEEGPSVSKIAWGGLIEQSYKLNSSLVYSINPEYNNHKPVNWDDFMTVVPTFLNCEQEFRDVNSKKIKRPSLTFGISVSNEMCNKEELSKILYVLEYLDIYQLISDILDDFINDFLVDYSKYLVYIEEQRRMI